MSYADKCGQSKAFDSAQAGVELNPISGSFGGPPCERESSSRGEGRRGSKQQRRTRSLVGLGLNNKETEDEGVREEGDSHSVTPRCELE